MKSTSTLALDLEGTLISHASTMVPRPGLHDFLAFCHQQFERVVLLKRQEALLTPLRTYYQHVDAELSEGGGMETI